MRYFSLIFLLALTFFWGHETHAATYTVTSVGSGTGTCPADSIAGGCTLRTAITNANTAAGNDVIVFLGTVIGLGGTITIPNGDLPAFNSNISLFGIPGLIIRNGSPSTGNVLRVTSGTVNFQDLNLVTTGSNTSTAVTAGIAVQGGSVDLRGITVQGTGNTFGCNLTGGSATVKDCTFVGDGQGIGFHVANGIAAVSSCTLTGLTTGFQKDSGSLSLINNLLAGNSTDIAGSFTDNGFNLSGLTAAQAGLDPRGLRNNGGSTPTIALVAGSPAIDAGYETNGDQRDMDRPIDLPEVSNASGGNGSDIGAFELEGSPQTGSQLVVSTLADHDDGTCSITDCSLREALISAATGTAHHDITFSVSGTINLTSSLPTINQDLTITGPADGITVSGASQGNNSGVAAGDAYYGLFTISGGNVTLRNFTLTKGYGGNGRFAAGALTASAGTVVLRGMTLLSNVGLDQDTVNSNDSSVPSSAGGIEVQGADVTLINSTLSDNRGGGYATSLTAPQKGGAGGAIVRSGSLTLVQCSIVDNTGGRGASSGSFQGGDGGTGGISQRGGTLIVANSIVSRNKGGDGGTASGSYNPGPPATGTPGTRGATGEANTSGTITQQGNNFFDGTPALGALADNGGPSLTYLPGSNLVDKGDNATATSYGVTTDQRGLPRPIGSSVDIGAVEMDVAQAKGTGGSIVVNSADDHTDGICGVNDCTLREALGVSPGIVNFDPTVFATRQTIVVTGSDLPPINFNCNITAPSVGLIIQRVYSATPQRVLTLAAGRTISLSGLTFQFAAPVSGTSTNSAGIASSAVATIQNCTFQMSGSIPLLGVAAGNTSLQNCTFVGDGNSLGIIVTSGTASVRNCTVTGNNVGVQNNGGSLNLSNSLVAGNTVNSSGTITNGGFNITNANATQARLDPRGLQDNGGPTQTIALLAGSPALNAGDPNFNGNGQFDQRGAGFPRVQNGRLDIGAFEQAALSLTGASVAEGNTGTGTPESGTNFLRLPLTLSSALTADLVVSYRTSDGTAVAGSDYIGTTTGSVTIPAGQTAGAIVVAILGDKRFEANETLSVTITALSNSTLGIPAAVAGTITNDDQKQTVSINSVSQNEGNSGTSAMTFTVSLSVPSDTDTVIPYITQDGSGATGATAGSDYVGVSNGSVTIPAGQASAALAISINGDTVTESDETFSVVLGDPTSGNATLSPQSSGVGTILNDETAPAPATIASGVSVLKSGFTRNRSTNRLVQTVVIQNASGAAINGPVYLAIDGLTGGTLYGASGTTVLTTPGSSPYRVIAAQGNVLPVGSTLVYLEFVTSSSSVSYNTRVLQGPGAP